MPKNLGGWIHSFTVTDTVTHEKGFTIYKITSIVFPRSVPEALTCTTVWKRYHEIKKLYHDLVKLHKTLKLNGEMPIPKSNNYFKRFGPKIIQIRKEYILELLDFIAQHPALYKSYAFLNFFENSHIPSTSTSPLYHNHKKNDYNQHQQQYHQHQSNIEEICDNLDLNYYDYEINLIDPNKDDKDEINGDKQEEEEEEEEKCDKKLEEGKATVAGIATTEQQQEDTNIIDSISWNHNDDDETTNLNLNNEKCESILSVSDHEIIKSNKNDDTGINDKLLQQQHNDNNNKVLMPTTTLYSENDDDNNYIYEAAYDFSQAVQFEVNQEYHEAYEKYKSGVDKLLTGSKDDLNEERKFIAKTKATKYMNRAEELYEKYLLNIDHNKKTVQLSIDIADSSNSEIYLERPWNQLSKFKVLQIIDDMVMQVQDVTDKSIYIMKAIEKPSINYSSNTTKNYNNSIYLPQDVPYMVQLLGFFQSDTKIYLLLQQANGGKLLDYLNTYNTFGHHHKMKSKSLNEIFTEIEYNTKNKIETIKYNNQNNNNNLTQMKLLKNYNVSNYLQFDNNKYQKYNKNDKKNHMLPIIHEDNTNNDDDANNKIQYVPSFNNLSKDMDVNDLLSYSQKLLKSVSNTLEQFKETNINDDSSNNCGEFLEQIQNRINDYDNDNNDYIKNNKFKLSTTKITAFTTTLSSSTSSSSSLSNASDSDRKFNTQTQLKLVNEEIMEMNKLKYIIPEVSIKQWARELVTAIDSLHQKGVILGDLRPDNLLLGSKGQLLLSYFYQNENFDNYVYCKNYINSMANENLYVAPERPLTIKSDWWSFGIILFELLTGHAFKLCHPSNLSCYFEIQYPDNIEISYSARDLLNRTIQYNPENRIGINDIKMHQFFEGTNWNTIETHGINYF